ncbi:spore cortex biosynthesis protein YabQ [Paenibacillus sepulcri]|uniref:Spore cortex biosynthesis protein YabQ n=1 Tax=Paenibacillus sepulcri TaxID=359917 RepID=A0ABS7C864_9BACL|nr:spore cortex biosynthesis protein YabQ [Paenibacillus sepulcri]
MSLSVQWWTMATMLLSGIGMGIVFDGYRVVSDELRIGRLWVPVLDLLYWIAATIIVFQVLSASNEGEVRAYVFLGLLLGIASYYWLFSKIVVKLVHFFIRAVRTLIQIIVKMFIYIVVRPLQLLYRLCKLIISFLIALALFLLKIVIQLTRPLWILVRWMMSPITKPVSRWVVGWWVPLMARWRVAERWKSASGKAARVWQRLTNWKKKDSDE